MILNYVTTLQAVNIYSYIRLRIVLNLIAVYSLV